MDHPPCQLHCWSQMSAGRVEMVPPPLGRRFKLMLKRTLAPERKRQLKRDYKRFAAWWAVRTGKQPAATVLPPRARLDLQAGERVRVRDEATIRATLDSWGELRGCSFMSGMPVYCGTEQRVLKPVRQFLDERDYRLKKCYGIVLLENVSCQGMDLYGPCDRGCPFFWREEWLERIE